MGSSPRPFGVTLRHRSFNHSTGGGRLPMGGSWSPCVYLAPLWRYSASNIGRMDLDTERMTEEWKKEGGKGREKESGKEKGR